MRDAEVRSSTPSATTTIQQGIEPMDKIILGQEWPLTTIISTLKKKTYHEVADFPDPLSLYALFCVIENKENLSQIPSYPFVPFKGRASAQEYAGPFSSDGANDHWFWIRILEEFLNCGPLVKPGGMDEIRGQMILTPLGEHMYPPLMRAFYLLYLQNDELKQRAASWKENE